MMGGSLSTNDPFNSPPLLFPPSSSPSPAIVDVSGDDGSGPVDMSSGLGGSNDALSEAFRTRLQLDERTPDQVRNR
jgi:hypothetical protein